LLAIVGFHALSVPGGVAQPQLDRSEFRFDITAQALADALVAYTRTTGMEILLDNALVVGRQSTAINGTLPALARC
jgi:hypothetical protein